MVHLLIGAFCVTFLFLFLQLARKRDINPGLRYLIIIILEFIYIAFVMELIYGFFQEGAFKGALIMGLIFGFPCIVAGILVYRWVLKINKSSKHA